MFHTGPACGAEHASRVIGSFIGPIKIVITVFFPWAEGAYRTLTLASLPPFVRSLEGIFFCINVCTNLEIYIRYNYSLYIFYMWFILRLIYNFRSSFIIYRLILLDRIFLYINVYTNVEIY